MIVKYFLVSFFDSSKPLVVPELDFEHVEKHINKLYPDMPPDCYCIEEIGEYEADGFGRPL